MQLKKAFSVHCEYSVHEGGIEKSLVECSSDVALEIENAWFKITNHSAANVALT